LAGEKETKKKKKRELLQSPPGKNDNTNKTDNEHKEGIGTAPSVGKNGGGVAGRIEIGGIKTSCGLRNHNLGENKGEEALRLRGGGQVKN